MFVLYQIEYLPFSAIVWFDPQATWIIFSVVSTRLSDQRSWPSFPYSLMPHVYKSPISKKSKLPPMNQIIVTITSAVKIRLRSNQLTRDERSVIVPARHVYDGLIDGYYSRHSYINHIHVYRIQSKLSVTVWTPNINISIFYVIKIKS